MVNVDSSSLREKWPEAGMSSSFFNKVNYVFTQESYKAL